MQELDAIRADLATLKPRDQVSILSDAQERLLYEAVPALLARVAELETGLQDYAAKLNRLRQQCDAEAEAADAQPGHALLANNYRTGARCYRNAIERLADYGLQEHGA